MAGRRRTLNRRDLREEAEALERREKEEVEDVEEEEADGDDEDDDGAVKKKKAKAKAKAPAKPRATKARRSAKTQRMRVVWTVFNNSHNAVAKFDYPQKAEADALAAKLTADKKSTHFVQPVKEPIEEKASTS